MGENPEIALEAIVNFYDQLVTDLASYAEKIQAKLIENKLLSRYQTTALTREKNLKSKTEYLLKDCIQFQLKKNEISHFKVLMDFMRTADENEQVLVSLYAKINKFVEDKTVPINPSHQVSDVSESEHSKMGMCVCAYKFVCYIACIVSYMAGFYAFMLYLPLDD